MTQPMPAWASYHAEAILSFITNRICPHCGDTLHKRVCDNRSGMRGQDWNDIYALAKKDQRLADKYFAARAAGDAERARIAEGHAIADSLGG
jgi:hypothetical protein